MPMEPRHPDEPALHFELRDALNRGLTNTDFFVWIDVEPSGAAQSFKNLAAMVAATEHWLADLDPDAVDPGALPEQPFHDHAGKVRITAIPKKPSARGQRAEEIVGNPGPVLVGWD
jgi:hypothetical protein